MDMNKMRSVIGKRLGWCAAWCVLLSAACTSVVLWNRVQPSGKVDRDVVYGRAAGEELRMDIYYPSNALTAHLPVVMYIHGGGWKLGGKYMLASMPGPEELLRRGYLVVAIDYRLAPKYKFPAMLDDVKEAVRYLRANAPVYNLDTHHIGVMGDSAGGHLAALLALTATNSEPGGEEDFSRVQAVVDLYGPTDFTTGDMHADRTTIKLLKDVFGATGADDPVLKRASPVTYVTSNAPPFLILHGDRDGMVDIKQSVELKTRLKAAGDDATFVTITNYAHGYTPLGRRSSPNNAELSKMVADFFDRTLR